MEPEWLGMGDYVIFRTLELKFLGRSHYKKLFHQNHMLSYIWWKRFVSLNRALVYLQRNHCFLRAYPIE